MKKISILLLMFVLLFTSTVAAHASTEAMALEVIDLKGYTVNVLEKNNVYEKLNTQKYISFDAGICCGNFL